MFTLDRVYSLMRSRNYNTMRHIFPVSYAAALLLFFPIMYVRLTVATRAANLCVGGGS